MDKQLKITNSKQFETLIKLLEKNPSLAKGFSRGTVPANSKQKWEEIAKELNAVGPPNRGSEGWQKVWRDLKFKTKKKLTYNKAECNSTGGGSFKQMTLTPLEESVANLMQFEKNMNTKGFVCGTELELQEPETQGQDFQDYEFLEEILNYKMTENVNPSKTPIPDDVPSTSTAQITETPARKKNNRSGNRNKNILLENHTNMQEKVLNDISCTLKTINGNLKDASRFQRKLYENQEKQLKLLEKRNKREEELFQSEIQLKKIKLEITKKELEVLQMKRTKEM